MNCGKCRWKENNRVPCQLLKDPPKDCRFFQVKKKKRIVNPERENSAAEDYLDYLHSRY